MSFVAGAYCPTGNNHKKCCGGVCGKYIMKDMLTINFEESSNIRLKCKREQKHRAETLPSIVLNA